MLKKFDVGVTLTNIKTPEEKQNIVLNVRSTNAAYIMYWHKICTDVAVAVAQIMVGVAAFAFTRESVSSSTKIAITGLFVILVIGHFALARYAMKIIDQIRAILQKLDKFDGLFEENIYTDGETLYPKAWSEEHDEISMQSLPYACTCALFILGVLSICFLVFL